MDLLLVSFSKCLILIRVGHLFIYYTFFCITSNVGLCLIFHILSLKLMTTLISYVFFFCEIPWHLILSRLRHLAPNHIENALPKTSQVSWSSWIVSATDLLFLFEGSHSYSKDILVFLQIFVNMVLWYQLLGL